MKKFFETLKDVLYDFMDYAMMLVIIVVVAGIIGWRLDILFAKDDPSFAQKDPAEETLISEKNTDSNEEDNSDKDTDSDQDDTNQEEDSDKDKESPASTITVHIPQGSSTESIGNILEEKDLISSTSDFNKKVKSMKLEKHLRAGDYDIDSDSSLETIVKVIANQ